MLDVGRTGPVEQRVGVHVDLVLTDHLHNLLKKKHSGTVADESHARTSTVIYITRIAAGVTHEHVLYREG